MCTYIQSKTIINTHTYTHTQNAHINQSFVVTIYKEDAKKSIILVNPTDANSCI